MKRKLYIDIDGVLITTKNPVSPSGIDRFIQFITSNFDCYWLTTHCKGESTHCLDYLKDYLSENSISALSQVKATDWDTLKTEAINLDEPFVWLDDYVFSVEKKILEQAGKIDSLIPIDLCRENELNRIISILKDKLLMW